MRASRSIHKRGGALESVTWRRGGAGAGARDAVDVRCEPDSYNEVQTPRTSPTIIGHILDGFWREHVV